LRILSVLTSIDFPKINFEKSPTSLDLPYPPKVDYCKLIIGIDRSQEKYRKCIFVVKKRESMLCDSYILMCLPSMAPMQLRNCHREYNYSAFFFHSSSAGCSNSVGDNLFQIASQIDML